MYRKTYVGGSKIQGTGVFARQNCRIGEILFFLTGELVTRDQMIAMGSDGDVLIQVDYKNYIIPTHPALYINHSCTPTVGIRDDYSFIALKYLHRGEELTLDYSTTMLERLWTLNCACGSPKCRSKIEDFDLIPAMLQQYYLERDVVQNFIAEEVGYHPDEIAA